MFNKENMQELLENTISEKKQTKDFIPIKKPNNIGNVAEDFLLPKQHDTLFWCYYIMIFGQFRYETLGGNSFVEEKKVKICLAETVKDNKELLKKNKWKKSIIENALVMDNDISLQTFFYICTVKNLNIMLQYKRCLYICKNNSTDTYNIITWNIEIGYMIFERSENERYSGTNQTTRSKRQCFEGKCS